jgi:hypothetical protein
LHEPERAEREQDPQLRRAELEKGDPERTDGVRGERDLYREQVVRQQERFPGRGVLRGSWNSSQ